MQKLAELSDALAEIVEKTGQAVVRVEARRWPASGVVWGEGLIVTADHVVERDDEIHIGIVGERSADAALVGRDPTTDLAVLRSDAVVGAQLPQWADPEPVKVGQLVLAISRPGRAARASLGIMSAAGGSWRTPASGEVERYLQPDVERSFGFSGGLLVDTSGRALGVNTTGLMRRTPITIPAPTIRRVVETLVKHGRIRRGYLGIGGHPVRLSESIGREVGQRRGLMIISVESGSPADRGGLFAGDILVAIDQTPIRHPGEVSARLDEKSIGSTLSVRVVRAGKIVGTTLTVGER
jgi:S1-C subfamily serine protease